MTDHPVLDSEAIAESIRAASLDLIAAELARKARTYADIAVLLQMIGKHETEHSRLVDLSVRAGSHAEESRLCFDACRALRPDSVHARDALAAAREGSEAHLALRVCVAVVGARAGIVQRLVRG